MGSGGQTRGAGINPKVFFADIFNFNQLCVKTLNSRTNIKKVRSTRGDPWVYKKMSLFGQKVNNLRESFPRPGDHIPFRNIW